MLTFDAMYTSRQPSDINKSECIFSNEQGVALLVSWGIKNDPTNPLKIRTCYDFLNFDFYVKLKVVG